MDKLLVVYNICGIAKDNTEVYPHYLGRIVQQKFDGQMEIIVSSCMPRDKTVPYLKKAFPECHYNTINDKLPINVTFNHAVLKGIENFGEFDYYAYVTCDSVFQTEYDMQNLFNVGKKENAGMVSAQIDQDSCYAYGMKLGRHGIDDEKARRIMFAHGDWKVPVGRACAAHTNFYSKDIQNYYGKCCPDIFSGYATESVWSFVCAAIKKNWIISKDVLVRHTPSLDVPSAGFRPEEIKDIPTHYQGFPNRNIEPIFNNDYAKSIGLGIEECKNIILHDPKQFDENFHCTNDKLKTYIKDNLYLSSDLFDYNNINHTFSI